MAKRALSWKRAGAIGWRDLKSAPGKFGFVVLSVAVGVASLRRGRGHGRRQHGDLPGGSLAALVASRGQRALLARGGRRRLQTHLLEGLKRLRSGRRAHVRLREHNIYW